MLQRGHYRVTVDPDGHFTTITLRDGQGQVTGGRQAFLVDEGSQVQVSGTDDISYDVYDLPGRDSFDQWSYDRDLRQDRSLSARYVSSELTGYDDLDQERHVEDGSSVRFGLGSDESLAGLGAVQGRALDLGGSVGLDLGG